MTENTPSCADKINNERLQELRNRNIPFDPTQIADARDHMEQAALDLLDKHPDTQRLVNEFLTRLQEPDLDGAKLVYATNNLLDLGAPEIRQRTDSPEVQNLAMMKHTLAAAHDVHPAAHDWVEDTVGRALDVTPALNMVLSRFSPC
ncbi:hypothetical protein [Arvimicrobium flavum]|uniref:hypothetical protein n=1 Tax=Arvimicrobium flavum TaxID=3393320 RepID=UPI00237BBAC6|nr:hypothetical protein [Mesorhizobium shangrilense]